MALRDWIMRLEKDARGALISFPQQGGGAARFPKSELREAFLTEARRLRGEDVEPHPLTL